jgi:hypothetical protein
MNARVQYIISADDKTRSAIASINRNFKDMERGVKGTLKGLNLALGVFAGVQLKQAFQQVLRATAESEAGARTFGRALNEVRDAARDLLVAKSGLPEATKAMQELRDTLKDPGIVAAADALTSSLIRGFANASRYLAEFAGGLRNLAVRNGLADPQGRQESIEAIDGDLKKRSDLLRGLTIQLESAAKGSGYEAEVQKRINVLKEEIAALTRRQQLLIEYNPSGGPGRRGAVGSTGIGSGINDAVAARQASQRAARSTQTASGQTIREIQEEIYGDLETETRRDMERAMDEINREGERGLDELHGRWEKWKEATRETIGELTPFADQAARNMQDAFADFLFDPFENGIKGMLKGFVDILRRMVAEAAAAKVFEALGFGQGGGSGGLLGKLFGGLLGGGGGSKVLFPMPRALGGPVTAGAPYLVGERGPELFVPGVSGGIVPNNRMGGGVVIAPTYNIDARGATSELINALPEILKRRDASLREDIIEGLRRGRY